MKNLLIVVSLLLLLSMSASATYRTERNLELNAENIKYLEIECGDGMLMVEGVEGQDKIEVEVELIISGMKSDKAEEMVKRNFEFTLEKSRDHAVLISDMETMHTFFSIPIKSKLGGYQAVDMFIKVKMPKEMQLELYADATEIFVSNLIGDIRLEGGVGEITFEDIDGDIEVVSNFKLQTVYIDDDLVYYDDYNRDVNIKNVSREVSYFDKSGHYIGDHREFKKKHRNHYLSDEYGDLDDFYYSYGGNDRLIIPAVSAIPALKALEELEGLEDLKELEHLSHLSHLGHLQHLGELEDFEDNMRDLEDNLRDMEENLRDLEDLDDLEDLEHNRNGIRIYRIDN